MDCPKCGAPCERESTEHDAAIVHGPLECTTCGWSEVGDWANERASQILDHLWVMAGREQRAGLLASHLRLAHCEGHAAALDRAKTEIAAIFGNAVAS